MTQREDRRFLTLHDVKTRTGMGRTFIYTQSKIGKFPKAFRIKGSTSVRWLESEIDAWMQQQLDDTAA